MTTRNSILFLHHSDQMNKIRFFYRKYLERAYDLFFLDEKNYTEGRLNFNQLKSVNPICLIYADTGPVPSNIYESQWPTICFQIDTFSATRNRVNISRLFDITIVFHPEFKNIFEHHNIKTEVLAHAIDHQLFTDQEKNKELEVAFLGDIRRNNYSIRKNYLKDLPKLFRTNDFSKHLPWEKMIEIYTKSKIVLNIGRNDFLKDANLRCFEAMASGALLFNIVPSELTSLGYTDGTDFIGFSDKKEMMRKLIYYLDNEYERKKISKNGQEKTLAFHNYELRIKELIKIINNHTLVKRNLNGYEVKVILFKNSIAQRNQKESKEWLLELFQLNFFRTIPVAFLIVVPFFSGLKKRMLGK